MAEIYITDKGIYPNNLFYLTNTLGELFSALNCRVKHEYIGARQSLYIFVPDDYYLTARVEIADKISEIVAVNYKYHFFKGKIRITGLTDMEKEFLTASLISADLEEDKAYAFSRLKTENCIPVDGIFNFRMRPLKSKWNDIVACLPVCFTPAQLKDFIGFLVENRRKKVFVENGKVYDDHFRRLRRSELLGENNDGGIVKEVLLSDGKNVELFGEIPSVDEEYLKEFFADKVAFRKDFVSKRS